MDSILKENYRVISITGNYISDVDHKALVDQIDQLIAEGTFNFVINMSSINFINSSGLGVLIRVLTKARTKGGEAVLTEIPEKVSQLLAITKLNNVFNTFATEEEAVASFKK